MSAHLDVVLIVLLGNRRENLCALFVNIAQLFITDHVRAIVGVTPLALFTLDLRILQCFLSTLAGLASDVTAAETLFLRCED